MVSDEERRLFGGPDLVGLTGGIATGKTTVSRWFAEAGLAVIDADRIARRVVRRPLPAWAAIVDRFGKDILAEDGEIDRPRLGEIVFRDPGLRAELDRIVHPRVFRAMAAEVHRRRRESPGGRIVLEVPLLIETGLHEAVPLVVLVYAPEPVQIRRLMARDGIDRRSALARIRSQMPIEAKRRHADVVIDNGGDIAATRRQADPWIAAIRSGTPLGPGPR
jgi:dephospho-CoA kinase